MDDDMAPDAQVYSSDDEDLENAHIPKVNLWQDWLKPLEEDIPATLEPAWSIPSSDLPVPKNNWVSALASTYSPLLKDSLLVHTSDMAMFMDWLCKRQGITELKPQDLEGPAFKLVKVFHANMKSANYPDVGLEQMVPAHMWIEEECKYDIAAMYDTMAAVNVNAPADQAPTMVPPTRTDDKILPHIRWVPIGKSNCYLDIERLQSNPIYKIAVDIIKHTNFFRDFTASLTIPSIYIKQFWDTVRYDKTAGCYNYQLDEQCKHKFYPRQDSPLHLPNGEPVHGYLKFSAEGTKREVFGMPIPNNLITTSIQGSDPDSPTSKAAKATKKSNPSAPKADLRPPVTKPASSQQPKPKPAPANSLRSVDESVDEGIPEKEPRFDDEEDDIQRAVEESLKSVYDAPRGPLPSVVIIEPDSRKFQPLPEIQGKGKEKVSDEQVARDLLTLQKPKKENLKLTVEEQVLLKEPASSIGTLSSLQHLSKDFSFGDLFFNDKPSEAENEKTTAETKAESMVSVTIQQDTSAIFPMTTPKTNSQKAHEDHMMLYKALEKYMNRDHTAELLKDLAEARKKNKKRRDSLKMPHGSPPHQPPPPPPPASPSSSKTAASAKYKACTMTDTRLRSSVSSIPEDLHMDDDMAPDAQVYSFNDEDIENAYIPKYQMEECHKLLTYSVDESIIRHNVSKPLPLGGPPGHVIIQSDFFFNKDLEYLRYGSKGGRPALLISKMKSAYYLNVGLEKMVPAHMWIEEELIDSPRAVTFWEKLGVQMIMRFNEIHKFSDGTLHQIDEALDFWVKEFKVNRMNPGLNTRFWTRKDVDRSKEFMFAIQKWLKTRRIFRNLKSFVGGRVRKGDYRILKRTE
nr:hypothetical protein [Tanacetum cinerariifolium]